MATTISTIQPNQILGAVAAVSAVGLVIAYCDYRAYVALGPHGLPDNFSGWCKQLKMSRKARKDTTVPAPYDVDTVAKACGPQATTSFLARPLGRRSGARPSIPNFVAPQRQVSDIASAEMKNRMDAYLESLVEANSTTLQAELSYLEGPVPAVQLKTGVDRPSFLKATRGEIIHIHPPDGSTHLVLSLADSKNVIEKSWGQRHRLSGGLLGWGYTLIYAPRTDDEYDTWKAIVNAAAKYCCADLTDVQLPPT